MKDIILIGGGGHCKTVIDSLKSGKEYNIRGILDLKEKVGEIVNGIKVINTDDSLEYYYNNGIKYAFISLGSIGDTVLRKKLYLMIYNIGYRFPNIIDKTALVSESVTLGSGNFVGKGAIVNSDTYINNNCIINTGAIIEHDCTIDSFCHIGPGVTMGGNVSIGENTHVGIGSSIRENIKIGKNSIIGAGSVVVKDIGSGQIAYGNPCREVKKCE